MNAANLGLLGGTFDPVHYGHIQLAEAALTECGLDGIIFIPAAEPPHKSGNTITPFRHRLAMLELVCQKHPHFSVSTIEELLPKPSYTIDTLQTFKASADAHYYFIIGEDAFCEIHSWKRYIEILEITDFIIAKRYGQQTGLELYLNKLGYRQIDQRDYLFANNTSQVHLMETIPAPCSATGIKHRLQKGSMAVDCLPPNVIAYIIANGLYREDRQNSTISNELDVCGEKQHNSHCAPTENLQPRINNE